MAEINRPQRFGMERTDVKDLYYTHIILLGFESIENSNRFSVNLFTICIAL